MSELQGSTNDFINQLVVKAIEKKKKNEQILANKLKPRLEHVLFSQFDVLETIESHNQKTTLYRLAKKGEPEKQICCKVLNEGQPEYIHDMFLAEATHLEISQHPSIAEFIKLGNEFERPYFMYRWVEGETVAEKLTRFKHKNFRHDHIAWLVYQLSGALEYIHTRGICHLDIKPSNIIICEDDSVKLIDFGASQYVNEPNRYNEASLSYTSPLFIESGKANTQDDVYSLAVLTYALFTGFSDNNDWKAKLNQSKRPTNIPKSVWILLQQVIKKPRSHGFTPISFAQELACIDTDAMKFSHNVPLFKQLRNADLVLRKRDKHDSLRIGRFKLLESVLAFSVLLITVIFALKMLNHPIVGSAKNKPEDKSSLSKFESSSNTNPAQVAAFLSQPPWVIESTLNKASANALVLVPYRKAVDVKNSQMRYWYLKQESLLEEQRKSQLIQLSDLSLLHKEMVSFRDYLKQMKYLSSGVDKRLVEMMATLNNLKLEHQNYNYSSMLGHEALAKSVILGEGKNAQEYMHNGWIKSQAEAYFYSYVLPKQVLNEILAAVNAQAEANFYSKAILALDEAIKLYGNNLDFSAKRSELVIKRSEYILFGTVTGEKIFQHDKLMTSLKELQSEDPIRFKDVIEVLNGISVDLLSKSFQQGTSTNGALLIEKALSEYQTGNVI